MGTEMIAKATDTFERQQRKSLALLEEPNLFTLAHHLTLALLAAPLGGHHFLVDDEYRLAIIEQRLLVVRGVLRVGVVVEPPPSILDRIRNVNASAHVRVTAVSGLSGCAELLLEN